MSRSELLPGLDIPPANEKLSAVLRDLGRRLGIAQAIAMGAPERAESLAALINKMNQELHEWIQNDKQRTVA